MTLELAELKTYQNPDRNDLSQSFRIARMESIYAQNKGKIDSPHRHDFFTILICNKAKGSHHIDFNTYKLGKRQVYFVSPGQVHQLMEEDSSEGFTLLFTHNFLLKNNIPVHFIKDLNLFNDFGESPPLALKEEQINIILNYAEKIEALYMKSFNLKYEAIGALLKLILIHCTNFCSLTNSNEQQAGQSIILLSQFKELIDRHHKEWHQLKQYAEALNVSSDHLNRVVKAQTGKRAKNHIQSRIMIAAKRMLYFTTFSNKEIAFNLGFQEPSHFSSFFKKCASVSPSSFRLTHQ